MEQFNISDSLKEKIAQAETLEEVAKICNESGIEVTAEELKAVEASENSELNEDELDNVAGGCAAAAIAIGIAAIGIYQIWKYRVSRR